MNKRQAVLLRIEGVVQGIGFRPEIYRRALENGITGYIFNDPSGVSIHLEGDLDSVNKMVKNLQHNPPPLAQFHRFEIEHISVEGFNQFFILDSQQKEGTLTEVSADLALCDECKEELLSPNNRRYQYPFINCTYCGPRFTIIKKMPYDRPQTSMSEFPLCNECASENIDPLDRRFHAQPVACSECGPNLQILKLDERKSQIIHKKNPIDFIRKQLVSGSIVGVKGIGGFHIMIDVRNDAAIEKLRKWKNRRDKPLALLAKDIETIERFALVSKQERELLLSKKAPIVLLQKSNFKWEGVAPNLKKVGVMLAYTPVHHLLLNDDLPIVVATSANSKSEPLLFENCHWEQNHFSEIIEYVLTDNRPIVNPIDDSVVEWCEELQTTFIQRRARGYAPESIKSPIPVDGVLGVGAEQNGTFSLGLDNRIYMSPYIGKLSNESVQKRFNLIRHRYEAWFEKDYSILSHDAHPSYWTTSYAKGEYKKSFAVYHHHAHMCAVMAEHELNESCIGIVLDGTGFGTDGTIWGMEIIEGNYKEFTRIATSHPIYLLGAETAIKEPWRIAASLLLESGEREVFERFTQSFLTHEESNLLSFMHEKKVATIPVSSCGRLFDGVYALLTKNKEAISYDGQYAMQLMNCAQSCEIDSLPFDIYKKGNIHYLDYRPMIQAISKDSSKNVSTVAYQFHVTLVSMICDVLKIKKEETKVLPKKVVVAGGCIQNTILTTLLVRKLKELGFEVYFSKQFPAGDASISLGQVLVAAANCEKSKKF